MGEKKKCPKCRGEMVGVSLLRVHGPPSRPSVGKSPLRGYQCENCGHYERSSNTIVPFRKNTLVDKALALNTRLTTSRYNEAVIMINKTWLDEHRNGNLEILAQSKGSRKLNKPTILMIDQDLTPPERNQVDGLFRRHNVLARIIFDPDDFDRSMPQLQKALELWKKEYIKRGAEN